MSKTATTLTQLRDLPDEELRQALQAWLVTDNEQWLVERHGFRSPAQVRRDLLATQEAA